MMVKKSVKNLTDDIHKLKTALDNATAVIYEIDYKTPSFKYVNEAMCKLFGYSKEEFLSMNPADILSEDSKLIFKERVSRLLTGLQVDSKVEYKMITKDFNEVYVLLDITFVYTDGIPDKALVIGYDITQRKKVEEQLRQHKEEFSSILNNSSDVFIRFNMQTNCHEYVSQSFKALFGYSPEELTGMDNNTALAMVHPDDLPVLQEALLQSMETGRSVAEYRQRHKNGDWVWVSNLISVVKDSSGRPLYRYCNIRDISKRKLAEQALKESEEIFRTIFDSMTEEVHFWKLVRDSSGQIKTWILIDANPATLKTHGIKSIDSIKGKTTDEIFGLGTTEHYKPFVKKLMSEKKACTMEDYNFLDKRDYLITSVPLGEYYMSTIVDITELKQVEKSLKKYALELEAANAELEAFSYSASHDLRGPIRSIDGFTQLLSDELEGRLTDLQEEHLKRIRAASQKLSALLDDMQRLYKVTSSEFHRSNLNLSRMVKSLLITLGERYPDRKIDFKIEDNVKAEGDDTLVNMALTNLLENAFKYTMTKKKAVIEFGVRKIKKGNIFFIKDNGIGFDKEYSEKIFAPFKRFHADETIPGTGIGLSIVERVIRRHGGKIWAEGKRGKGAAFYFTLGSDK